MALTLGEREEQIRALNEELLNLMNYFTEVMRENSGILESHYMSCTSSNMHAMVALLMEEKSASYSRLASEIYEKAKERENSVTIAIVKSSILYVGQRSSYGVPSDEADVLEDETHASLWCWETRDMKLLPKSIRGSLKVRRTCRKKIGERITAIHAMLQLLQTPSDCQNYRNDFRKASQKLSKVLNESNIRMLVESSKINGSERTEMETKKEEKALAKQLERKRYEEEKEKKKMDRELLKEKLQREKEMKRLQEEAEKEEKQLKRKRDEIERDQRRLEKEESEQKRRRSLQKQASIMERFLHKNKSPQTPKSENDAIPSVRLSRQEKVHESVTFLMDSALLQKEQISIEEVRKSHLKSWHHLGNSIKSRSGQHWDLRRKPKTALVKDLRLSCSNGTKQEEELNTDSMLGGWSEPALDDQACNSNINFAIQKCRRTKQLLQFDKSYRPAFYGVWPKMSNIVGPRNPYKKDPELDYDVDSDEEWEEEEPGESLSECDKDEEEILGEGLSIAEDGEESEDGFFVPDGYLSENEGVQSNRSPCRVEAATSSRNELEAESENFSSWVRQIKHLHKLTEIALSKNQPLIVTNMKHERADLLCSDNLTGSAKVEHICLQALAMRSLPNGFTVELHSDDILIQEDQEAFVSTGKTRSLLAGSVKVIPDSELPEIVATIESFPYGMKKLLEILLQKFPNCSKSQLKSKVRQISDFVDNKWQVGAFFSFTGPFTE